MTVRKLATYRCRTLPPGSVLGRTCWTHNHHFPPIEFNPNDAGAFNNRGGAYLSTGRYDRAIADFDLAIRLNPNDANAIDNRNLAQTKKAEGERALRIVGGECCRKSNLHEAFGMRHERFETRSVSADVHRLRDPAGRMSDEIEQMQELRKRKLAFEPVQSHRQPIVGSLDGFAMQPFRRPQRCSLFLYRTFGE
jgi:tetratricopeptide (TPR) repeat protein